MHGLRIMRVLGLVLTAMVLLPLVGLTPSAQAACPGNILRNPGFEEGFSERGAGEVTVANGWEPYWASGALLVGGNECGNMRPEYKGEDGARYGYRRIHEGHWSQKWFNTFAHHNAGIRQQVNVVAGSKLTFTAWAQAWSSQKDNANRSEDGGYAFKIGIDPTGGTDPNSGNVVWSNTSQALDTWTLLQVEATATAGTVTVFLRGEPQWCSKHNDLYFDDACLVTQAPPTAKPRPTNTPGPTNMPAPTDTPEPTITNTPEPTPLATDTPEPTPTPLTGVVRVVTFEDRNGNGTREAGEPLLAGAEITLSDMNQKTVASIKSAGGQQRASFEGLQPGSYIVSEQDPPGYASTSPNQWALTVVGGATQDIYFADHYAPTAAPTQVQPTQAAAQVTAAPPETPAPYQPVKSSGGFWGSFYNISGIIVAALALLLPIGLRALRDRL